MQTTIKSQYDAGSPGDLVILPSFNSAAKVESCRAGGPIAPGDAVKLETGADSSVIALEAADDASISYGVAVSAHSNMPTMPAFGNASTAFAVSKNSNQGIVTNGPICVAVKSGQTPKRDDLAKPVGRNSTTGFMEWGVATSGQSRFKFASPVLPGGIAHVMVIEGALLGKSNPPVISVTGVTVSPDAVTLAPGATQQLTATVEPANATDKTGAWSGSDDAIATISASGLITVAAGATAAQTVEMTYTTTDGVKTDSCTVTVGT